MKMKEKAMSRTYFDFQARRWYAVFKPDPKGDWDGKNPLAYREYVDGEPQPEPISQLDNERFSARRLKVDGTLDEA